MDTKWVKYMAFGFLFLVLSAVVAGCDWGDAVRVDTPQLARQGTVLPEKMSLNDAVYAYDDWLVDVRRAGERWKGDIERATQVVAFLDGLTLKMFEEFGPAIAGVPVLGAALPAVLGIVGFSMRRPGDVSGKKAQSDLENLRIELQAKADALYDEGLRAGREAVLAGASAVRGS